jgi:hypothetical protein
MSKKRYGKKSMHAKFAYVIKLYAEKKNKARKKALKTFIHEKLNEITVNNNSLKKSHHKIPGFFADEFVKDITQIQPSAGLAEQLHHQDNEQEISHVENAN